MSCLTVVVFLGPCESDSYFSLSLLAILFRLNYSADQNSFLLNAGVESLMRSKRHVS